MFLLQRLSPNFNNAVSIYFLIQEVTLVSSELIFPLKYPTQMR